MYFHHFDFLSKNIATIKYIINEISLIVKSMIESEMKIDKNDAAARLAQKDEYTLSADREVPILNNSSAQNIS